jgi:hypothetical protein
MPAVSVDTFFACSLMVLLVLAAMATTSKILYPHLNNQADANLDERYAQLSKYFLLNEGTPANWGQISDSVPQSFGLAKNNADNPYELDIDKVSKLNSQNSFALTYAQIFAALQMPDVSLKLEIKPLFDVDIKHAATYNETSQKTYSFDIATKKQGASVGTELKCYVIARNYFASVEAEAYTGRASVNVSLPNSISGPALFVVLARSAFTTSIASFNAYAFSHGSSEPEPNSTFLTLSPLNHDLNVTWVSPEANVSEAYALTFNYNSTLTQTANGSQSVAYDISRFLDSSPTIIVVTGWNLTTFFAEWTAYPQIPVAVGPNLADALTLSNVMVYTYTVTIDSAIYECTISLGGLKE